MIMRHGLAENDCAEGDYARQLTTSGKLGVKKIALQLSQYCLKHSLAVSRIIHSPFVRTTQTASIIVDCFKQAPASENQNSETVVDIDEGLVPSAQVSQCLAAWAEGQPNEVMILVTHQPFISQLIAELVTGYGNNAGQFPMYPSDAVFLEGEFFSSGLMTVKNKFSIIGDNDR